LEEYHTLIRVSVLQGIVIAAGVAAVLGGSARAAETPPSLQSAFSMELPALSIADKDVNAAAVELRKSLAEYARGKRLPSLGIEYVGPRKKVERVNLSPGTFAEQLTQLTAEFKYVWLYDGDWLNLTPANLAKDPAYIFNLKVMRQVVCSRDSTKATSLKDWINEHDIIVSQDINGLFIPLEDRPWSSRDPIVLINPTWREVCNAHTTVWGENFWSDNVKTLVVDKGLPTEATKTELITRTGNLAPY
jgi:hypothetical protein